MRMFLNGADKPLARAVALLFVGIVAPLLAVGSVRADGIDAPTRVARLAYLEGSVSFQPGGTNDWVAPPVNRPLTTGDRLWTDSNARVELQLDGSVLRMGPSTAATLLNVGDNVTQIQVSSGTVLVRVRRLDDSETYEIDTPNLAFSVLRAGTYRVTVDPSGTSTAVEARSGQGEVTGGGVAYPVRAAEYDVFSGTDQLAEDASLSPPGQDAFDAWSMARDGRRQHSASAAYVSPDVVGYEDLDDHGQWTATAEYGNVWVPRGVARDWAPYHYGHWAFVEPWGYTWVDDSPWGFAPFHYGRWVTVRGAWGWIPAPPPVQGAVYVRPVYAPALVAWVGVGEAIAWFALGPREVYVPSYPASRTYVNNLNVSNTTVNTTTVNNIYNSTVINNTVNNVTYVNQTVQGAVIATSSQAFASAQPVARNIVHVDARTMAAAPARAFTPAVVPTKQSVLGAGQAASARPPEAVVTRTVVARIAPPARPPAFEQRQAAIQNNGGKPLSIVQVRQLQPPATQPAESVKIAPPAHLLNTPARAVVPSAARIPEPPPAHVASPVGAAHVASPAEAAHVASPVGAAHVTSPVDAAHAHPVHPNDVPPPPLPPSASDANSVLERAHLQQQQQLHAQQEAERQRVQSKQDAEHQQQAKQAAEAAQRALLERQHEQETAVLAQKHAQEQQKLLEKQLEQKRQQEKPAVPRA